MQNSNLNQLAKNLNDMKNPSYVGASVGKVIKLNPTTISIAGGLISLVEGEELYISDRLKDKKYSANVKISGATITGTMNGSSITITNATMNDSAEITIKPELQLNDLVFVVPLQGEQTWVAVDRVGGIT